MNYNLKTYSLFFFIFHILLSQVSFSEETLLIWTSTENVQKAIQKRAIGFEKDFKLKVKVSVLGGNVVSQFKAAAMANRGPDIIVWAHDVTGELAQSGLIEPIKMTNSFKKQFIKSSIEAFTYQGKIYGYPYDVESVALIYNPSIYKKRPKSFEEIFKFSSSLKKEENQRKKRYGFLYDVNNFFFSFPLISANGGYIFKQTEKGINPLDVGLSNQGAIIGMEYINKLAKNKIVPASTDRSIAFTFMKNNQLGAMIDGPWAIKELKSSKVPFKVIPLPTLNGKNPRPFVGSHGFMIRRKSQKRLLSKEFIERYLVTKEGIFEIFKMDPRGPSRHDVIPLIKDDYPNIVAFLKSSEEGIAMPNIPQMGAVWSSMKNALELVTSQKLSPKKALNNAVLSINSMIKEGK